MSVFLKTFLLAGILCELSVEAGGYPSYPVAPQPQASFGVNLGTALKEGGEAVAALSTLFGGTPQPQTVPPAVPRAETFAPPAPTYGTGNYGSGYPQQGQYPSYPSSAPMTGYPSASARYSSYTPSYSRPTASLGYVPQVGGYEDPSPAPQSYGGYDHPGRASVPDPEYYEPSDQSGRGAGFEDPNALPYGQDTGADSGEMGDGYQNNSTNRYDE